MDRQLSSYQRGVPHRKRPGHHRPSHRTQALCIILKALNRSEVDLWKGICIINKIKIIIFKAALKNMGPNKSWHQQRSQPGLEGPHNRNRASLRWGTPGAPGKPTQSTLERGMQLKPLKIPAPQTKLFFNKAITTIDITQVNRQTINIIQAKSPQHKISRSNRTLGRNQGILSQLSIMVAQVSNDLNRLHTSKSRITLSSRARRKTISQETKGATP